MPPVFFLLITVVKSTKTSNWVNPMLKDTYIHAIQYYFVHKTENTCKKSVNKLSMPSWQFGKCSKCSTLIVNLFAIFPCCGTSLFYLSFSLLVGGVRTHTYTWLNNVVSRHVHRPKICFVCIWIFLYFIFWDASEIFVVVNSYSFAFVMSAILRFWYIQTDE